jgi:hypothetical protein
LLFSDLQPTIVETTDLLAEKHDAESACDYFWKNVSAARLTQRKRVMDEQIESAYVALYGYVAQARPLFHTAVENLRSAEEEAIDGILDGCQKEILAYDPKTYNPAILGNKCRDTVGGQRKSYFDKATTILAPVKQRLEAIVSEQDGGIIAGLNNKTL